MPVVGETLSIAGFEFEITQMQGRRILQVRVTGSVVQDVFEDEH